MVVDPGSHSCASSLRDFACSGLRAVAPSELRAWFSSGFTLRTSFIIQTGWLAVFRHNSSLAPQYGMEAKDCIAV